MLSFQSQAQLKLRQATNWGGGHWITFDGPRFDYYALGVQLFADNGKTGDEAFRAEMLKVHSVPNDQIVWSEDFAFQIGQDRVLITQETLSGLRDNAKLFINGEEKPMIAGQSYDLPSRPIINGLEATRKIMINSGQLYMTLDMGVNDTDGNSYTETLNIGINFYLRGAQPYGDITLRTNVMGTHYGPIGSNNNNPADDACDAACQINTISVPFEASLFAEPDTTPPMAITQDITVELDENGVASITPAQINNGSTDDSEGALSYTLDRTDFGCNDLSASCSGSSLAFNGTGIASGANGDNIQNLGLNQLTMEAWVKPNGGTVNSIIRKAGDYDLYIVNNILYAEVWYEGRASSAQYLYTGPDVSDNVWSHVAFTFDKANSGSGKFYVNGVETAATGTIRSIAPDIALGIGGSTEFGQSFTGLIDDVRIWSVERTNAQINEFKDFCIDANSVGLEAYFKIEANEGTTLTDYSGNGNHLTITGASWSFEGAPIESKEVEITLTVTDESGNTSTATAHVTVEDNIVPILVGIPADVTVECAAVPDVATVSATDNCSANPSATFSEERIDGISNNNYTLTRTWTTTDASGNTASGAQVITVVDNTGPTLVGIPADVTVECDAVPDVATVSATDNCSANPLVTFSEERIDGISNNNYTLTRTWTTTDESGNTASGTQVINVADNIDPTITLNGSPTVFHDAYTDYIDLGATATDNCSSAEVSVYSPVDTDVPGSYTVTLTATDASGNEASTTRTVIVRDIMSPTVNTQATIASLGANGNASITANNVVLSSSDDSGVVNVSLTGTDFACDDLGDNTVLVNAEDGNGNGLAISQDGLVGYWKFGGANPLVDLTGNWGDIEFVGNASLNNGVLDLNANGFARTSGYSGNTITSKTLISYVTLEDLNVRSGAAISIDGITTDNFDAIVYAERQVKRWMNGSSFFRRTQDLNPGFAETETGQLIQMAITYENIGSQVIVTLYRNGVNIGGYTSANASNWTPGNMEILFGARHSAGNTPFGSMDARISKALLYDRALSAQEIAAMNGVPVTVAVVDEIAPEISDPLDVSVLATSAAGAVVNYVVPVGTDNCNVTTLLTAGLTDGATFPIGTTVVTYTATDGAGNTTSASFNVEVAGLAPEIITPSNITVSTDAGECGAIVRYAATETTAIPASTITYDIQPGSSFAPGTTKVTATATNPVGTSTKTFSVTVVDDEAPTIPVSSGSSGVSLPLGNSNGWSPWVHDFNLPIPDGAMVTGVDMNFNAVDQGWGGTGAYATFEIQGQTIGIAQLFHSEQNYNINYSGSIDGYVNSGNNQLKMFFQGYSGWVAYFRGGSMTISYTIQGTRANDLTVYLDASGNASVLPSQIDPGVTDNCGIESVSLDQPSFNCSNIGANEVNLIAVDSNGNESTFASTITVIDDISPAVTTRDISIILDASGTVSITAQDVLLSGADNCGPVTYALSRDTFGVQDALNSPVTIQLTGTDPSGNATLVDAQVTVIDPIPVVVTKDITVSLDETGNAMITPQQIDNGSSSIIGLAGLALDITSFDCSNVGTPVTVTLTATSTSGSSASATAVVTVEDNSAPEFLTRESLVVYLDANGIATVTPDQFNRETVSDNCGVETITFDKTTFNCDERGFNVINITATDASGNTTVGQADVEVRDEIAPTVITKNITVDLDENGNATISPSDVDGGTFDNCAFTLSLNIDSFTCAQVGENIVELTAHDQNGVFASANATVTVRDVTAPEFLTRESFIIYLDANGIATVTPDQFNRETVSDNCGVEIITFDKTTFSCDERGFHVINITATDASGNTTVGQADVEVRDEIAPTVITKNITVDLDENGNATISPSDIDAGTFDNCAFTLSLNIDSFTCAQVGENIVELTAHDQNGVFASANATVTVRDIIAPTVITKDAIVALDANGTYTVTPDDINNGTFDNCTFDLSVTNNLFDCSTLGEHTVTLTATDASGNTTSASAVVTVVDNAGPVIVVKNIDVFLDENGNASITLADVNEGITDACGVTSTTIDTTSFDCSNLGANTVTLTATDIHGNTSTETATVTVIDNIGPTVITKNITVDLDAFGNATISPIDVLVQEEVTDYCVVANARWYGMLLYQYVKRYRNRSARRATAFVFSARERTFIKNPDGTATITGTLTDRFDVGDSWSVRLNLKNARNWEEWSALGNSYAGDRAVIGDKYLDWTYYEMGENSELIGRGRNKGETIQLMDRGGFQVGEGANRTNADFGISGQFGYYTRRGRRSTGRFYFDLENCISITKKQDGPLTDDNCGIAGTSLDITSFDCNDIGDNTVNVTVKDKSGNATTVPATVTVRDVTAPVVRAQPTFYAYLGSDGTVTIDPRQVDAGSRDNCGIVSYSLSKETFNCRDSYYRSGQNVTYTVTDASGNSSSTVVNIRVADIQAPVISSYPITLVVYGRRSFRVSKRDIASRITDNCGVARFYNQTRSFTRDDVGSHLLWVVATDNSRKRTSGYVRVNVVDLTQYGRSVPICYQGRSIKVPIQRVQIFLNRGATIGSCDTDIEMSTGGTNLTDALEREFTAEPLIELGAFPNPSQGETTIKFSSDVAGPAMAVVMSPNGVRMNTLFDGVIAANENVELSYNTSELPSGMYIIRLVTAGKVRNLKLMVKK